MFVTTRGSMNCQSCPPPRGSTLFLLVALMGICQVGSAQTAPVITTINPASVAAGNPTFTLTVTGSGFTNTNSVVQINGSNRPTVYRSTLQLTATVFASDIATPATLQVTVANIFGTGVLISNAVPLTVSIARSPSLISVSPEFTMQGADHVRMTLVGANFRPGATVVISPPLAAVTDSNGRTRATDVAVLSVAVVNPGLMTALFSVSPTATLPTAALPVRAVDVLNLDGTSTAGLLTEVGGTSQPLRLQSSSSLGAPLSVLNMALTHPRDGTVVMQGGELNAEAILAGTGTGTVIGQWVWDGNVVEQFSASIVGGQSTRIQTRQSLPTWFLGAHTLYLRMVQPNQIATRPIVVVVNPGDWKTRASYSARIRRSVCSRQSAVAVVGSSSWSIEISGGLFHPAVSFDDPHLVRCGGQWMESPNSNLAKPAGGRTLLDGTRDRIVGRTAQAFADEKRVPCPGRRFESGATGSCAHSRGPYAVGVEAGAEEWFLFRYHQQ